MNFAKTIASHYFHSSKMPDNITFPSYKYLPLHYFLAFAYFYPKILTTYSNSTTKST